MSRLSAFLSAASLLLIALFLPACQSTDIVDAQPKTVSDVLTETTTFSMMKAAVQQAGLTDALKANNLTLFAPTDDAFRARGYASPEALRALSPETLRGLVRYHIVFGVVTSQTPEVLAATNLAVETSSNATVFLTNSSTGLFVNGKRVTRSDQTVANGVVHTVESVLIPSAGDALTTLRNRTDLTLLNAALTRVSTSRPDLVAVLNGTTTNTALRRVTIFAPTDAAFNAAGYRSLNDINNASVTTLANILSYHVVSGALFSNQLQAGQLTTFNASGNNRITVAVPATGPTLRGNGNSTATPIREADIVSNNAIIHVINQVLLP